MQDPLIVVPSSLLTDVHEDAAHLVQFGEEGGKAGGLVEVVIIHGFFIPGFPLTTYISYQLDICHLPARERGKEGQSERVRERLAHVLAAVVRRDDARFSNGPAHPLDAVEEEYADEEGFEALATFLALETSFEVDKDGFAGRGGTFLGSGA